MRIPVVGTCIGSPDDCDPSIIYCKFDEMLSVPSSLANRCCPSQWRANCKAVRPQRLLFSCDHLIAALAELDGRTDQRVPPHAHYDVQTFKDGAQWCCLLGENLQNGIAGFGDTAANAREAFDVAYLTECATGLLDFDVDAAGDLYASVTLPSLLVGTVGGGSQKGTAQECLALLGCRGTGSARTFAEILAAVVLAGDLSLMAAFTTHEFVAAHEQLGRNRPEPAREDR